MNQSIERRSINGYSINQRINQLISRIEIKFVNLDRQLEKLTNELDLFVRTSLSPVEGILLNSQISDAYKFVTNFIRSIRKFILFIDNYVDEFRAVYVEQTQS